MTDWYVIARAENTVVTGQSPGSIVSTRGFRSPGASPERSPQTMAARSARCGATS
jgi:hypothetical protein